MVEKTISIQLIDTDSFDYEQEKVLREEILRIPLGMHLRPQDIEGEEEQIHFVARNDRGVIGCLLLQVINAQTLKFRQAAVEEKRQRQGIGRALVDAGMEWARANGFTRAIAHVRYYARPFWEQSGFRVEGDTFEEVGLKHFFMTREIKKEDE